MQITLSQLKEIAKAGYGGSKVMFNKLDEFEFCPSVMAKIQDCHVYYVDNNGYSRTILRILYRDKKQYLFMKILELLIPSPPSAKWKNSD